jgi:hypothetical protein
MPEMIAGESQLASVASALVLIVSGSGIVNQNVNGGILGADYFCHRPNLIWFSQIDCHESGAARAVTPVDLSRHCLTDIFPAAEQNDFNAVPREGKCRCPADAGGGAGDNCCFAMR